MENADIPKETDPKTKPPQDKGKEKGNGAPIPELMQPNIAI